MREDATKESDAWACGIILCEMLSGYIPFHEKNLEEINEIFKEKALDPEIGLLVEGLL